MIHYLPIFLPERHNLEKYNALKGVAFRFLKGNYQEQSSVFPLLLLARSSRDMRNKINILKSQFSCHLGIGLVENNLTEDLNAGTKFMLLSPLILGQIRKKDIITIFSKSINTRIHETKLIPWSENVSEEFNKKFRQNFTCFETLAYIAADIAIRTYVNAGPGYDPMRHFLTHTQFECIPLGKLRFTEEGYACLIGKTWEEFIASKEA